MKKLLFVAAAVLAVLSTDLRAQQVHCGMSTADQLPNISRLQANLAAAESTGVQDRGVVKYLPIYFHLVAASDGTGRVNPYRVLENLCKLNAQYLPYDIQFFLQPHATYGIIDESINNNNVYNTQTNLLTMNSRKHTQAINVFVANNAVSGNTPIPGGIVAGYYTPANDWIVYNKSFFNLNPGNSTVSHEIGHWLSLNHTFYGWEGQTFDASHPNWPCAPATINGVPVERQDGSNCTIAGDMICDTPPDYGFFGQNCAYTGGAKDPVCVPIDPMENNFMAYFEDCVPYLFTPLQEAAMHADIESPARNFLDNNFAPVPLGSTSPTTLKSPINNAVVGPYNSVTLEWKPVSGATYYLVQADLTPTFGSAYEEHKIVTDTFSTFTTLEPNRSYHWRVTPFNQFYSCDLGVKGQFKTALVGTNEVSNVETWSVSPNPVGTGVESVSVLVRASESFNGNLVVFTATGQRVHEQRSVQFAAGQSSVSVSTAGWANGLYYVALENETGRSVRKVVVLR